MKAVFFLYLLLFSVGCASVAEMDQSLTSHSAMDLHTKTTPDRVTYLSSQAGLGANSQNSKSSSVCTTCAH